MKTTLKLFLAIALFFILLLTACGSAGKESADPKQDPATAEQQESEAEGKTPTEDETAAEEQTKEETEAEEMPANSTPAKLLYMGHSSVRIETPEGKVIYVDPYVGDGYDAAADLILVTHAHYDHNAVDLVANRSADCRVITWTEALEGGSHQTFDLGYVTVEAVEAGNNPNHSVNECVGYILTLSDGISVYFSGDTSRTEQMTALAEKEIDYAFYCCDGVYNMDPAEAAECARIVGAKHNIPYHMISQKGVYFDRERAEQFDAPNRLIIEDGEEIELD